MVRCGGSYGAAIRIARNLVVSIETFCLLLSTRMVIPHQYSRVFVPVILVKSCIRKIDAKREVT